MDEFLLFLRRALAPVHGQSPPGDFLPVKDLISEFVQALLAFGLPIGGLELRVVQNLQDLIGGLPNEVRGFAGHGLPNNAEPDSTQQKHGPATCNTAHAVLLLYVSRIVAE